MTLSLLTACQSVPDNPLTPQQIHDLSPFSVAIDAPGEPLVSIDRSTDYTTVTMGMEYGAIGGALASLAVEARAANKRKETIKTLGQTWTAFANIDADHILEEAITSSREPGNGIEWIGDVTVLNEMSDGSMKRFAKDHPGTSIGIQAHLTFSTTLESAEFVGRYQAYWPNGDSGKPIPQVNGRVSHVFYLPQISPEPIENARFWQEFVSRNGANSIMKAGFDQVIKLVNYDLTATPAKVQDPDNSIHLPGVSGAFEKALGTDRVLIRTWSETLYSIPLPPIIERRIYKVAIQSAAEDEKDTGKILGEVLAPRGIEIVRVGDISQATDADVYVEINSEWTWDLVTYLKMVHLKLFDPKTGALIGFGGERSESATRAGKPPAMLERVWSMATAEYLKIYLE